MFNILCFGDSNTHGFDPDTTGRYDISTRWTGRVSRILGDDFRIIEAGTNGMTVGFGDNDGMYFNGTKCLPTYLLSQRPLDGIVIMLGTNDTKAVFASNAKEITEKMRLLIHSIRSSPFIPAASVRIILIAPVPLIIQDPPLYNMDETSGVISRQLGEHYRILAEEEEIYFADAGKWGVELCPDGCHISPIGGYTFAMRMSALLREIFCRE